MESSAALGSGMDYQNMSPNQNIADMIYQNQYELRGGYNPNGASDSYMPSNPPGG